MANIDDGQPFTADAIRKFQAEAGPTPAPAELNPLAQRAVLQFREDFITPRMLCGLLRAAEFVVLAGSGLLSWLFVRQTTDEAALVGAWPAIAGAAAGVLFIGLSHGYDLSFLRGRASRLWRVVAGCAAAAAFASALLLFLLPGDATNGRGWLMTWFAVSSVTLVVGRLILAANVRRWARNGRMERRAVIVGGGKNAETLIRSLEMQPDGDIRICGIFDDRDDTRSPPIVAGYPKLGTIAELVSFARLTRIDMLIVTLPLSAERRLLALLKHLWVLPLDIRLSAHSAELKFRPRTYSFVGQVPLIDVFDRPLADWDGIVKRIFDIVIASIAIVALLPVFLVTAIAIRLDSTGPVLFRQKRHGFNNQIVEVFKFRSLYHEMSDPEARTIVTKNDKRVTRVGAFIRKSSIDELPQLFNVLRGDLSLVGPRPHAVHAQSSRSETFVEIVDGYFGRHKVKPGITGWAQINGWRGEIDEPEKLKQRFEHDLYYIENWSLLFDIYILVMTPISLFRTNAAY
ncbi:undecaprenyl-phosphate glucose phosphotransferase [Aurantimonas sp. VKM B-3413]|uniref:undecaprenyl-phosphate glucose phosphotransferase n=1 Tax=Aurantimonas sp. VKM B-3413 TaxID=2779401 RepID=UPI001E543E20|nr:undecaprenyl-phosphate glucose phosphotransferase [Aurantimonas sp. VKM B-3413]MCB8839334.1 undecaprenyl-phosphate glucose phosphotransferase [Aurantimonas sp. VKM B-3413]